MIATNNNNNNNNNKISIVIVVVVVVLMTLKGGTSQACAACKYQRRRCTSECPLAPYFPPDQPKLFQNAHRLFGVSNILKILKKLEPDQKPTAMWSIIYQSNERDRDPVHGCLARISHLRYQIWHAEQELLSVQAHLQIYRQQQQNQNQNQNQQQLELVMGPPTASLQLPAVTAEAGYNNSNNGSSIDVVHNHHDHNDNNNNINPMWVQYPYDNIVAQPEVAQDYDEMPFFDTMDDRQSYIDSKEAYDSSSEESVLKVEANQTIDLLVDNELKNAAACLSLTSDGDESDCVSFDLRPSDAINIAVRCKVPIQVNKYLAYSDGMRVVESGKILAQIPASDGLLFTELDRPSGQPCVETKEFDLVRNMLIAAVEERYRDAAQWRDKLSQLRSRKNLA